MDTCIHIISIYVLRVFFRLYFKYGCKEIKKEMHVECARWVRTSVYVYVPIVCLCVCVLKWFVRGVLWDVRMFYTTVIIWYWNKIYKYKKIHSAKRAYIHSGRKEIVMVHCLETLSGGCWVIITLLMKRSRCK